MRKEKQNLPLWAAGTMAGALLLVAAGCGEGGDASGGSASAPAATTTAAQSSSAPVSASRSAAVDALNIPVTVTGTVTYTRLLPLASIAATDTGYGTATLDFANPVASPCRYVVVQALDSQSNILTNSTTDQYGNYTLQVPTGTDQITVRVLAQTLLNAPASAPIIVEDNTNGGAPYATLSTATPRTANSAVVNISIPSGYDSQGNTSGVRPSGPFACLDGILTGYQLFMNGGLNPSNLPQTVLNWSISNTPAGGDATKGNIGTSHYDSYTNALYILGDAKADTDEYDWSVIVHEFGHWMQHNNFRDDSPGGSHSFGDIKDPRLVMSEGFGNALGAIALNNPIYQDTNINGGFSVSFEPFLSTADPNPGWYSEFSWNVLLWHFYTSSSQYPGHLGLPLSNFFAALTYQKNAPSMTTPFSFLNGMVNNGASSGSIATALASSTANNTFGINSQDQFAAGETHNAGVATALPVFTNISANVTTIGGQTFNVTVPAQPDLPQPAADDGSSGAGTSGDAQSVNWMQGGKFYVFTGDGNNLTITAQNSLSNLGKIELQTYSQGVQLDDESPARPNTDVTTTISPTVAGQQYVLLLINRRPTTTPTAITTNACTIPVVLSH